MLKMDSPQLVAVLCLMVLAFNGCYQEHVVKDTWGDFARLYGNQARKQGVSNPLGTSTPLAPLQWIGQRETWAIALISMDQPGKARAMLQKLKRLHVPDLWIGADGDRVVLYRGRYDHPATRVILNDLRQSRMIRIDGARLFSSARIVAARPSLEIAQSEMDLRRYRQQHLWTLQVAVYDELIGKDFRKKAEQAAKELRKAGDPAFFYHGPNRSMVTIGLMTYDQAWTRRMNIGDAYSPRVLKMQEKYPYNLYNGRTIIEKKHGKVLRQQPSFLVQIK